MAAVLAQDVGFQRELTLLLNCKGKEVVGHDGEKAELLIRLKIVDECIDMIGSAQSPPGPESVPPSTSMPVPKQLAPAHAFGGSSPHPPARPDPGPGPSLGPGPATTTGGGGASTLARSSSTKVSPELAKAMRSGALARARARARAARARARLDGGQGSDGGETDDDSGRSDTGPGGSSPVGAAQAKADSAGPAGAPSRLEVEARPAGDRTAAAAATGPTRTESSGPGGDSAGDSNQSWPVHLNHTGTLITSDSSSDTDSYPHVRLTLFPYEDPGRGPAWVAVGPRFEQARPARPSPAPATLPLGGGGGGGGGSEGRAVRLHRRLESALRQHGGWGGT